MKLKYNFVIQEVCDMYMAVAVGEDAKKCNAVINLNETAKFIFELLQQGKEDDEIIKCLQGEYEGDEATFRKALHDLKEQLKDYIVE